MVKPGERLAHVKLTLVDSTAEVADFLSWLGESRRIMGVDIETSGLSLSKDHIRLVQFGDARRGWAIPYRDWRGLVKHALESYEGPIVLHNAPFDYGMLQHDGIPVRWDKSHDTMPMCFLNDSLGPRKLKTAAARYVDTAARVGEAELKQAMAKNKWTWGTVPVDFPLYWGYGALDTVLTAMLAEELLPTIKQYREAYDLEMAVERILSGMEMRGIRIDTEYCEEQTRELKWKLEQLLAEMAPLNPFSTDQVVAALQGEGILLTKLTDGGKLAVDEDVLSHIDNPLAQTILKARKLDKLISSYFENFLYYRDGDILNPHIHPLAARTGRMSVSEPALQQVPKNSLVRDAFIAREGRRLVLCDYDNQELRVAAGLTGDPKMIEAFESGRDLHMETARKVYGDFDPETPDGVVKRGVGKRGMFSKAYGAGVPTFAKSVGLPEPEAKRIFDAIDAVYPGLNHGMARVTAKVRERAGEDGSEFGYVVLVDGRHIRVRSSKAYVGFNAYIQGTCAVVLKRAIVDLDAAGMGDFLLLPVHDENLLDVPKEDLAEAVPIIEATMRRDDFRVPLTVSAKVVDRWGDAYRKKAA